VIALPDKNTINHASHILLQGGLVAFPTETVYGLGADARNDQAVAKIFALKGRPQFNPLIVHISTMQAAQKICHFDDRSKMIAEAFWPGPLSIVLKQQEGSDLSLLVSAGLDSIALRIPGSPLARELITRANCPIAAPSANKSGRVSPTTAKHVIDSFTGQKENDIELILDGGPCEVGLESTVIDLTQKKPQLLRPGAITYEALSSIIGDVALSTSYNTSPKSPGMLTKHYAPRIPLRINALTANTNEALLGFGDTVKNPTLNLSDSSNLTEAATNLFSMLRQLDNEKYSGIAVTPIPERQLGRAINDRLRRAAQGR
tara:strand:+ start:120 stop:1070 length:951 start_codon:yes stop_codon:yes gene_type:complete